MFIACFNITKETNLSFKVFFLSIYDPYNYFEMLVHLHAKVANYERKKKLVREVFQKFSFVYLFVFNPKSIYNSLKMYT